MSTKIETWQIVNGKLEVVESSLTNEGRTETYDLEEWIASNPAIIGSDLRIIGRQVSTKSGSLDLLAIDKVGNLVIVELKRDKLPRKALAQAIDYASDISSWSIDKISEISDASPQLTNSSFNSSLVIVPRFKHTGNKIFLIRLEE